MNRASAVDGCRRLMRKLKNNTKPSVPMKRISVSGPP